LSEFNSDERTLTDELCDMLCIWSQSFPSTVPPALGTLPGATFDLSVRKTTTSEEVATGADLELTLRTPAGSKTALLQAKVFDAPKGSLRYDSKKDWERLRKQLANTQSRAGDLAFLLLYIPASLLNGDRHAFSTWEQSFVSSQARSATSSSYGITLIPAEELLNKGGGWNSKTHLRHTGAAQFTPAGMPLRRLLFEMLACRRGSWDRPPAGLASRRDGSQDAAPPYRRLELTIGEPDDMTFQRLSGILRAQLDEDGSAPGAA
jgi:hypothetical protein